MKIRLCSRLAMVVGFSLLAVACGDDDTHPPTSTTDLTVASLNILHGINCPPASRQCRLGDRIELLFQWIAREGCPDVVTLQEMWPRAAELIAARLSTACPFTYEVAYFQTTLHVDDEMLLSRYPIQHAEVAMLFGDFRSVLWGRIDHPIGPVDVFSTHLASSSDQALEPCVAPTCPAECLAAAAVSKRDCQAVQLSRFAATKHDVSTPAVITGDFNDVAGSFAYRQLVNRGWPDVHLAAGNAECDAATGQNCTAGRQDERLVDLESPARNENERIDFIFLIPAGAGSACRGVIDSGTDRDGDGMATGLFAGAPNPFAPSCGPSPQPICWPSDHVGAQLDLNCE